MPTVKGSGTLQQAILAQLDGQPVIARDLIRQIVGGEPTPAQYNGLHRAMRLLAARGQLATWLQPGQRHLLVVRRVDRWVSDSDSGTFTEQQRAADPFKEFVDEAWRAFRSDVGYAVAIAEAAARLARLEHRDPGAFDRFDTDTAHGGEGGPPQVSPLGSR